MSKRKWTRELREMLYQGLVDKFGPYYTWGKVSYPINKKKEYNDFLNNFAIVVSTLSGKKTTSDAVSSQIAWALTPQETVDGYADQFILNMSAAYETGFLRSRDLPKVFLVERQKII